MKSALASSRMKSVASRLSSIRSTHFSPPEERRCVPRGDETLALEELEVRIAFESSEQIHHRGIVRAAAPASRHLQPRYLAVDTLEVRTESPPATGAVRSAAPPRTRMTHPLFRHVCLTSARQSSHCKTTPERQRRVPLIKMRDRTINCGNNPSGKMR